MFWRSLACWFVLALVSVLWSPVHAANYTIAVPDPDALILVDIAKANGTTVEVWLAWIAEREIKAFLQQQKAKEVTSCSLLTPRQREAVNTAAEKTLCQ